MRTDSKPVAYHGAVARAAAEAHKRRDAKELVQGYFPCTRPGCRDQIRFTVFPSGTSHGRCTCAGCVEWSL